jgi:hypothetical protein
MTRLAKNRARVAPLGAALLLSLCSAGCAARLPDGLLACEHSNDCPPGLECRRADSRIYCFEPHSHAVVDAGQRVTKPNVAGDTAGGAVARQDAAINAAAASGASGNAAAVSGNGAGAAGKSAAASDAGVADAGHGMDAASRTCIVEVSRLDDCTLH